MQKIIYLPGWLNPAENLRPLAELVGGDFELVDMPTDKVRTIADFADWLADKIAEPVVLVGHSIGGKIAIAAAARHPEKVAKIFVVSGSSRGKLLFRLLKPAIKLAKFLGFSGRKFQTADYRDLPIVMKKIMQRTLSSNIMPYARALKVPAVFIYSADDVVTPAKLGRILARAAHGKFCGLTGFTHNSIITDGAYQVSAIIKSYMC